MVWGIIGTIIAVVLVIATAIIVTVLLKKKAVIPNIASSGRFVINFLSRFTDGTTIGWEIEAKKHESGRTICKFWDIDNPEEPIKKTVVVGKNMRIELPSKGRIKAVIYYPKYIDDLPDKIIASDISKMHTEHIIKEQTYDQIWDGLKKQDKKVTDTIRLLTNTGLERDLIEKLRSITEEKNDK